MRSIFTCVFFVCAMALGCWFSQRSWDSAVYVYLGEDRAPASVRTAQDYTRLPAATLTNSPEKQLIAMSEVQQKDGQVGIQLGHPLLVRERGVRNFACQVGARDAFYDKIEITFTGNGVATSGEPPQMIVESACQASSAIEKLEPIWIPMKQITGSPARDQELQTYGDKPLAIQLKQIPGEWPTSWFLSRVRLYPEGRPEEALEFEGVQLREAKGVLLSFDYTASPDRQPSNK